MDEPFDVLSDAQAPPDAWSACCERLEGIDPVRALQQDPIRWHTIERLWAHAQRAPEGLRAALAQRLSHHLQRLALEPNDAPVRTGQGPAADALILSGPLPMKPLSSLEPMRQTHARLKVRWQLRRSLAQPLQHAGPLHSERLVQQALLRLSTWSEPYLHRLLPYLDALATLEDAQALPRPVAANGSRPRAKVKASTTTKR